MCTRLTYSACLLAHWWQTKEVIFLPDVEHVASIRLGIRLGHFGKILRASDAAWFHSALYVSFQNGLSPLCLMVLAPVAHFLWGVWIPQKLLNDIGCINVSRIIVLRVLWKQAILSSKPHFWSNCDKSQREMWRDKSTGLSWAHLSSSIDSHLWSRHQKSSASRMPIMARGWMRNKVPTHYNLRNKRLQVAWLHTCNLREQHVNIRFWEILSNKLKPMMIINHTMEIMNNLRRNEL